MRPLLCALSPATGTGAPANPMGERSSFPGLPAEGDTRSAGLIVIGRPPVVGGSPWFSCICRRISTGFLNRTDAEIDGLKLWTESFRREKFVVRLSADRNRGELERGPGGCEVRRETGCARMICYWLRLNTFTFFFISVESFKFSLPLRFAVLRESARNEREERVSS